MSSDVLLPLHVGDQDETPSPRPPAPSRPKSIILWAWDVFWLAMALSLVVGFSLWTGNKCAGDATGVAGTLRGCARGCDCVLTFAPSGLRAILAVCPGLLADGITFFGNLLIVLGFWIQYGPARAWIFPTLPESRWRLPRCTGDAGLLPPKNILLVVPEVIFCALSIAVVAGYLADPAQCPNVHITAANQLYFSVQSVIVRTYVCLRISLDAIHVRSDLDACIEELRGLLHLPKTPPTRCGSSLDGSYAPCNYSEAVSHFDPEGKYSRTERSIMVLASGVPIINVALAFLSIGLVLAIVLRVFVTLEGSAPSPLNALASTIFAWLGFVDPLACAMVVAFRHWQVEQRGAEIVQLVSVLARVGPSNSGATEQMTAERAREFRAWAAELSQRLKEAPISFGNNSLLSRASALVAALLTLAEALRLFGGGN